ncbi:gliding motility-associated C-terminal domain-containing protein, partial [Candidatus Poribacteria bacterium]|nr:gliding motility-associated C-terminal domain-containing protein [Candidatus Poribacteria bacterium]
TGKVVRTLNIGHTPAGVYQSKTRAIQWDGRNNSSEQVASGIYFYTLTANTLTSNSFTATRKLLILK